MINSLRQTKGQRKIVALTCYDYTSAKILAETGVDILLVGDSLGMVLFGYANTHFVTLDDMIRHTQAVMRANPNSLIVADMPIVTCDNVFEALKNCRRMIKETGVKAVKIEGKPEIVAEVVKAGIEVMGHTGLKPQEVEQFKIQGKNEQAKIVLEEALSLEKAGCFSIILECIPALLAKEITKRLTIPTIGIGAGADCDGQILVLHDMLGLFTDFKPRFVRRYGKVREEIVKSVADYMSDVREGRFPAEAESY